MGELLGKQILPREWAAACATQWQTTELVKAVAAGWSESALFIGAYNDNVDAQGNVVSRDCGIMEINIPASDIGTSIEFQYRSTSTDPNTYKPIIQNSMKAARALYDQSWTRNGQPDLRRWQPWYGYTFGWATFPHAWVWHQDANHNPVGPWMPTGRYLHKAICGVANYHLLIANDMKPIEAVHLAQSYATHFGLDSEIFFNGGKRVVSFRVPPHPTAPPHDGVGPRPIPNDGV